MYETFQCFAEFLADKYENFSLTNIETQIQASLSGSPPARILTDQVEEWIKETTQNAIASLTGDPYLVERTESELEPIGPLAQRRHEAFKQTVKAVVEFLAMDCRARRGL